MEMQMQWVTSHFHLSSHLKWTRWKGRPNIKQRKWQVEPSMTKLPDFIFGIGILLKAPLEPHRQLGRKLRSPFDLMKPDLHRRVEREQERKKQAQGPRAQGRSLQIGEAVYARNFGQGQSWLDQVTLLRTPVATLQRIHKPPDRYSSE